MTPTKPYSGVKVTAVDSQGKKFVGTTDANGVCTLSLPEGNSGVIMEGKEIGSGSSFITITSEHPANLDYNVDVKYGELSRL